MILMHDGFFNGRNEKKNLVLSSWNVTPWKINIKYDISSKVITLIIGILLTFKT